MWETQRRTKTQFTHDTIAQNTTERTELTYGGLNKELQTHIPNIPGRMNAQTADRQTYDDDTVI